MIFAEVAFPQGDGFSKPYDFKIGNLLVGPEDWVLCDTKNGYSLGQVVCIKESSETATRFLIAEVDKQAHDNAAAQRKIDANKKGGK